MLAVSAELPPEHAIKRLYVLPVGSAAEFMAELDDDTSDSALSAEASREP